MNTNCKILLSAFIFIVTVPTTLAENTKKEVSCYKWDEGTQCVPDNHSGNGNGNHTPIVIITNPSPGGANKVEHDTWPTLIQDQDTMSIQRAIITPPTPVNVQ